VFTLSEVLPFCTSRRVASLLLKARGTRKSWHVLFCWRDARRGALQKKSKQRPSRYLGARCNRWP